MVVLEQAVNFSRNKEVGEQETKPVVWIYWQVTQMGLHWHVATFLLPWQLQRLVPYQRMMCHRCPCLQILMICQWSNYICANMAETVFTAHSYHQYFPTLFYHLKNASTHWLHQIWALGHSTSFSQFLTLLSSGNVQRDSFAILFP